MQSIFNLFNLMDFLLMVTIILFAVFGALRGFARTLAGAVGILVSMLGGLIGMGTLSDSAAKLIRVSLAQKLPSYFAGSSDYFDQIGGVVADILKVSMLKPILFTLFYLLTLCLWMYACSYTKLLTNFHSLQKLDQAAGVLAGVLKGFLFLCVVFNILSSLQVLPDALMKGSFFLQKASGLLHALAG